MIVLLMLMSASLCAGFTMLLVAVAVTIVIVQSRRLPATEQSYFERDRGSP